MTEEKKEKKLNVLQLTAVSLASVGAMCFGSIFGIRGTYIGTGVGTLISGILAYIFEKMSIKTKDRIRSQNWFFHSEDEDATSMFPAIKVKRSQRPWLLTALAMGMALVSAGIAFGVFGIVKATAGTTLGDYSTPPKRTQTAPAVTVTPTVTSSPEDTFTPSESFSESSSPIVTPTDTITVTATPSASPDSSPSPSPSPSVSTSDSQQ